MKNSNETIFVLSFFITLLMGVLSYMSYQKHREKELAHLTEFWASIALGNVIMAIFRNDMTNLAALSMIGWIWPLRTFKLVLEDISESKLFHSWHFIAFGAGAFITIALSGYNFPFIYSTLPFSIAVGGIGLFLTYEAYRKMAQDKVTPVHLASFFLIGIFFLRRLIFPLWRLNPDFVTYGFFSELFFIAGFAGTGLSTYLEMLKGRHDVAMEKVLKDRSDKFVGQSKYSELGMLSAGIAHEINNPLAVIQARTTQLLRIYKNPEKQKELGDGLQQILYTSERINRTIQGVREFVHQDEKEPSKEIPLKNLFDDVLAFCGQRMKNHGVNLRLYGLENFSVIGHKVQLEQVILNLLNNSFDAIEYLPDKWIEVSSHQKGDKIQLYFKDSGHGIPPEIANRMMEPFFTTKEIGKGTGLGLALARGIVEKHGGTIEYLSEAPHTTFLLELPRVATQEWGIPLH